MNSNRRLITAISITIIVTAFLTFVATANLFSDFGFSKLTTAQKILDQYFYKEFDKDRFDEAATRAGVNSLNDPYTQYMSADEWTDFQEMLNENYCGIGVVVSKENIDDYLLVVSTLDNSPAKDAGLETGDKITAVEGETTKGLDIDEIVSKIKGEEGTKVKITVQKYNTENYNDIELERKRLDNPVIASKMLEYNIGYIEFASFNENSSVKFIEHMNNLINDGASSLIFDLRANGGGLTKEAEAIANAILPKDCVIYSTKNRAGRTNVIKTTKDGNTEIPIVVLVDGNTASASEILSAAIKENNRGTLVGTKTFGKGLVQTVFNLYDGSAIKVTIEQYFTSSGNDINKQGITPDHIVELKSSADEQLMYAIDLLKQ